MEPFAWGVQLFAETCDKIGIARASDIAEILRGLDDFFFRIERGNGDARGAISLPREDGHDALGRDGPIMPILVADFDVCAIFAAWEFVHANPLAADEGPAARVGVVGIKVRVAGEAHFASVQEETWELGGKFKGGNIRFIDIRAAIHGLRDTLPPFDGQTAIKDGLFRIGGGANCKASTV